VSDLTGAAGDDPDAADARLLHALGSMLGTDPPPEGLNERARALVEILDVDSDLAELLAPATAELAGARGATDVIDTLTFELADASVTIELELPKPGDELAGLLTVDSAEGATGVRVDIEDAAGVVRASGAVDDLGRFVLAPASDGPVLGPVRLRVHAPDERPIATDWFLLGPRRAP
jgi:hypothetical protein